MIVTDSVSKLHERVANSQGEYSRFSVGDTVFAFPPPNDEPALYDKNLCPSERGLLYTQHMASCAKRNVPLKVKSVYYSNIHHCFGYTVMCEYVTWNFLEPWLYNNQDMKEKTCEAADMMSLLNLK